MKKHHNHSNLHNGKHLIGMAYSFRGLGHYHHSATHDNVQADKLLENELKVLHLYPQVTRRDLLWMLFEHIYNFKAHFYSRIHFLQQGQTCSKATTPNCDILYGKIIQSHETMEAITYSNHQFSLKIIFSTLTHLSVYQ